MWLKLRTNFSFVNDKSFETPILLNFLMTCIDYFEGNIDLVLYVCMYCMIIVTWGIILKKFGNIGILVIFKKINTAKFNYFY